MNSRGYFLVARGLFEHPRFKPQGPFSGLEAWLWLIGSAAHTARDVMVINGRHRVPVHLEPGQLTFSVRFLAEAWKWSDKRVQRFLAALVADQSVTTQTTTGQTLITLCNWATYQRPHSEVTTQNATQTTTQSTTKRNELNEFNDVVRTRAREPAKPLSEKGSVSAERQAAIALGLAFVQAAGFRDHVEAPNNWYGVTDRAAMWIANGWTEQMIVAVTRHETDKRGVVSVNYYEKAFATAAANAVRPVPLVATPLPGVAHAVSSNRRGNISRAADQLIAAARAREQAANPRSTAAAAQPSGDIFEQALRLPPQQ
jgi:hypothetical protein